MLCPAIVDAYTYLLVLCGVHDADEADKEMVDVDARISLSTTAAGQMNAGLNGGTSGGATAPPMI